MKKFLALILALVMVFSLSSVAFAETINGDATNPSKPDGSTAWQESNTVTVKANDKSVVNVYYVNIVWDAATYQLTYNKGTEKWDPQQHVYVVSENGWTKDTVTVGVYNHSDLPVTAVLSASGSLPVGIFANITNFDSNKLGSAVNTTIDENKGATGTTPYAEATYKLTADRESVTDFNEAHITLTVTISVSDP